MPLADHLNAPADTGVCRYAAVLASLEPADAATLASWVSGEVRDHRTTEPYGARRISYALRSFGVKLSRDAIHRHRAGTCPCGGDDGPR